MGKICLIRPPRVLLGTYFTSGEAIPPIGMAYLISSLRQASFEVCPIDAIGEDIDRYYPLTDVPDVMIQGMYLEDVVARIPKDVFLIGLSCMFSCEWFLYEALITQIKRAFPKVPIVVGGEHVTAEALNVLRVCGDVDVCVSGEGEETLIELARAYESGADIRNIAGISHRDGGRLVKNGPRARIREVDSIPWPSWEGIPVRRYHEKGNSMTTIRRRAMPVMASRGCPFRCTFCTSPQMWGTQLNLRSPESVIAEIRSHKEKYDIEHIDFVDLVGVLNRSWIKEFLTLLIEANLGVTWLYAAGTRSEILDDEILRLFKASHVLRIFYAPESGSKETLERINKRVNLDKITRSIRQAHALGISMRAPLIYGFPGQTLKEAFQSLWFGLKLSFIGVDDVVAHGFSAHPGTELHHELVKAGKIDIDQLIAKKEYNLFLREEFTSKKGGLHSWSSHLPDWLIPFFQYGGMFLSYAVLFTAHPRKIVQSIDRVFFRKKPLTVVDHVLFTAFIYKRNKANADPRTLYDGQEILTGFCSPAS